MEKGDESQGMAKIKGMVGIGTGRRDIRNES